MAIRTVAILGTRGRLGPWLLDALVESGKFQVRVLQRAESTASLPSKYDGRVETLELPPDFLNAQEDVVKRLTGLDALVMSIPGGNTKEHQYLANCCVQAGVKRFIPADFGSVDSSDSVCIDTVSLYRKKKVTRDMLQGLAMMYSYKDFSWTSLICGHFFDYGIETQLLGFDVSADPPQATIFDDGDKRWSASTRTQIGRALVAILEREQETKNRMLYIQSFSVTQNELLAVLERVSGKSFRVTKVNSEDYIKKKKEEMEQGTGHDPVEELVGVLGLTRADWTQRDAFANEILGLQEEDLNAAVQKALTVKKPS